ncbi:MAG: hipA [Paucimonas sp.]|nr:hipA [Paucimonas sp.]
MAGAGALNVWLNGEFVAIWSWSRTDTHSLRYTEGWLNSHSVRPLSLSLPILAGEPTFTGPAVKNYFDNLLPDNERIRDRLRTRFRTGSIQPQDLLAALGRDCVGAVQLLPLDATPEGWNRIEAVPLSEEEVQNHLRSASTENVFRQDEDVDDFRISIAGAQEKSALLLQEGRWCQPKGATPTTHIFKLPLGLVGNMHADMMHSVENEWLCLRILHEMGFNVAEAGMGQFGDQKALIVKRFDRRWIENTWIARLPQEDFCQATGTAPNLKYESDGGPGMATCMALLGAGADPDADKLTFVRAQLAFWLMAATDGHAKNFSIHLERGSTYRLTPLYDVISMWPIIGDGANQLSRHIAKLAMAVRSTNAHYKLTEILPRHWRALAQRTGVPGAFDELLGTVNDVPAVLASVEQQLPNDFPERVWTKIRDGVLDQQRVFLRALGQDAAAQGKA